MGSKATTVFGYYDMFGDVRLQYDKDGNYLLQFTTDDEVGEERVLSQTGGEAFARAWLAHSEKVKDE